jgi:hypothetical protein
MDRDDDIAVSLPPAPPPAPAKREATIEAALRQFDGETPRAPAAPTRPERRWLTRPQLGTLVAAALVAVIGAPIAWMTATQPTQQEMASTVIKTYDVAAEPSLPPMVAPPPTTKLEPAHAPPPTEMAEAKADALGGNAQKPQEMASIEAEAASAPEQRRDAARGRLEQAPAVVAPPMIAMAAPAAPPPPPAAVSKKQNAEASSGMEDMVVTAQRRSNSKRGERGDWNACTVNDPSRNLALCKRLVDPGAKGPKGQAAAHIADGLRRAWQGDSNEAIAAFDKAIAVTPKSAFAWLNRGLVRQQEGDLDDALADFDQAVRLDPLSARGYYSRSLIQRERGDTRKADRDAQRAVELDDRYEDVVE